MGYVQEERRPTDLCSVSIVVMTTLQTQCKPEEHTGVTTGARVSLPEWGGNVKELTRYGTNRGRWKESVQRKVVVKFFHYRRQAMREFKQCRSMTTLMGL